MSNYSYEKKCPECQAIYLARRLNQVYCSSVCKNRFNNRISREQEEERREKQEIRIRIDKITHPKNSILWKNRCILERHVDQTTPIHILEEEGFKLNFITDFSQDENGDNLLHIYDFGYRFLDEVTLKIFSL